MAASQNGYSVILKATTTNTQIVEVGNVQLRFRKGSVADVLYWVATAYHETVEPLVKGQCGSWNPRKIGNSGVWSNHASATAMDFNWRKHPDGTHAANNMTDPQIRACRQILNACDGVVRWGEDFRGEPDPMHWEIVGDSERVAALAALLRREMKYMVFSVEMPVLQQGDRDNRIPGYNMIVRIQRIINVKDDGIWGPKTSEGIAVWLGEPVAECRVMTEDLYRRILGLSR